MKRESTSTRLKQLMKIKKLRQADIVEKTGLGKSAISQYVSGKITPKQDKIYIIANAYNISPSWLMGYDIPMEKLAQKKETSPTLNALDERDIQKRLQEILDDMTKDDSVALYNGGEPMDAETRELMKASLENALRISKLTAKKKFTPKKYKDKK